MFKYLFSTFWGMGGLSQKFDNAAAGEGEGGVSDKMLTLLMLGGRGVGNFGPKA